MREVLPFPLVHGTEAVLRVAQVPAKRQGIVQVGLDGRGPDAVEHRQALVEVSQGFLIIHGNKEKAWQIVGDLSGFVNTYL